MTLSRFREPTSGLTHLAAAILSLVGLIWLIVVARGDFPRVLTLTVYGLSMVALYLASAIYHLTPASPRTLNTLVRLDRVGIFLLIAGTYTPLVYHFSGGAWRWGLLTAVWAMALGGSLYTLFLYSRERSKKLWMTLFYVGMGCVGVVSAPHMFAQMPPGALGLILGGGAVYIAGAVIYTLQKPNFHRYFNFHDLWHLFVMAASALFFAAILIFVAMA